MSKDKRYVNIGTVGHVNHGETSLTEAIAAVLSRCPQCLGKGVEKDSEDFCGNCGGSGNRYSGVIPKEKRT